MRPARNSSVCLVGVVVAELLADAQRLDLPFDGVDQLPVGRFAGEDLVGGFADRVETPSKYFCSSASEVNCCCGLATFSMNASSVAASPSGTLKSVLSETTTSAGSASFALGGRGQLPDAATASENRQRQRPRTKLEREMLIAISLFVIESRR